MSHYELFEAYHNYVLALSESEEGAGALADFLFELVDTPRSQAFAWLKEALDDPDESLAKVMGGLDFADWLAEREGDRIEASQAWLAEDSGNRIQDSGIGPDL